MQGPPGINGATGAIRPNRAVRRAGHSWRRERARPVRQAHRAPLVRSAAPGPAGPSGAAGAAGSSGGEAMANGQLVVSAAAGALTVAVKTLAGADPAPGSPVVFRIPNASGTYRQLSTSLQRCRLVTVPSRCASRSGDRQPPRSDCGSVAFNNAGSIMLGIGRMSAEVNRRRTVISPLADSAAGAKLDLCSTPSSDAVAAIIYSSPRRWRSSRCACSATSNGMSRGLATGRHVDHNESSLRAANGARRSVARYKLVQSMHRQ